MLFALENFLQRKGNVEEEIVGAVPLAIQGVGSVSLGSFSIVPWMYEIDLNEEYGVVLGELRNGQSARFSWNLKDVVSFTGGYEHSESQIRRKILRKYSDIPGFCSMQVETSEDLLAHVRKVHKMGYLHYAWAKESNLEGCFPRRCCGSSSRNVFLSLMEKGYPNSSYVYNSDQDHGYVVLPFLLTETGEKGFVISDPTSDQLFHDKRTAPRNNLFVVFGDTWEYKTDWKEGSDLYPSARDHSKFANLHTLREHPGSSIYGCDDINDYFKLVFDNPVKVEVDI